MVTNGTQLEVDGKLNKHFFCCINAQGGNAGQHCFMFNLAYSKLHLATQKVC